MKPMWILELAFLLLPVSLVAEASPEETTHPVNEVTMHAYRAENSVGHGASGGNSDAHPVDSQEQPHQGTVKGKLIEGGISCPLFETEDHRKFTLVATPKDLSGIKVGETVELTYSSPVLRSDCMQGVTVSEIKIEKVK